MMATPLNATCHLHSQPGFVFPFVSFVCSVVPSSVFQSKRYNVHPAFPKQVSERFNSQLRDPKSAKLAFGVGHAALGDCFPFFPRHLIGPGRGCTGSGGPPADRRGRLPAVRPRTRPRQGVPEHSPLPFVREAPALRQAKRPAATTGRPEYGCVADQPQPLRPVQGEGTPPKPPEVARAAVGPADTAALRRPVRHEGSHGTTSGPEARRSDSRVGRANREPSGAGGCRRRR